MQERTFVYCRPAVRNDHWDTEHLQGKQCAAQRGHMVSCDHPKCKGMVQLEHVNHYRNHVATVHKVKLRAER